MNFAAQLLYSSYLSERLQRLYSPRPALKDTEENDPFWQRWELHLNSPGILWEFLPKPCSHQRCDLWSQGFDVSFCLQLEFQKLLINVFLKVIQVIVLLQRSIKSRNLKGWWCEGLIIG